MKVGVVCPYAFDAHGGVQDQVARIVGWLQDSGHEAWAVAPGSGGPEGTRHVGGFISVRANRSRAPISLNPLVVKRVAAAVDDAEVLDTAELANPQTRLPFHWARLRTLGGILDVVAASDQLEGGLTVGGIVHGSFWLSGKLIDEPGDEGKPGGFWRRLLRKRPPPGGPSGFFS